MHVFTYGSLMFPEVWERVVKERYRSQSARIFGMRSFAVLDELYPAAVQGVVEDRLEGIVYLNVEERDLLSLDRFEGEQYVRKSVVAETEDGESLSVQVYEFKSEYHSLLDTSEWDAERFRSESLVEFLRREQDGF
ncbi:gamma-glutamylcyclotransferase [Thiomicrorhabdus sp. ZW0627]|uniref:gamma-glutamylcyclotransferase family protein n=1 Tax=Thiomicrorhabdus sp. ZW0627 TaxID=3039774 RepID=UPI002436EB1F|nr:gamma-glutamylcyclotransferase [Thiomicrorhabdus sp. ZW0627]MDG6773435.1 gamma-glutamylcyclotransferase [Thiomicrorhabdus sp. ZW0627]